MGLVEHEERPMYGISQTLSAYQQSEAFKVRMVSFSPVQTRLWILARLQA